MCDTRDRIRDVDIQGQESRAPHFRRAHQRPQDPEALPRGDGW